MKIATPVSTLFASATAEQKKKFNELSDCFEVRDHIPVPEELLSAPKIYHSEFSIVALWTDGEIAEISEIVKKNNVSLVSLHVLSCYFKPEVGENGKFFPSDEGHLMDKNQMLQNAEKNMARLRKKFPDIEFIIENNNYFPTGAYEIVTEPGFLNQLADKTNVGMLLDIGHAEITAKHTGVDFFEYIKTLKLKNIRQIHLSGIGRGESLLGVDRIPRPFGGGDECLHNNSGERSSLLSNKVCPDASPNTRPNFATAKLGRDRTRPILFSDAHNELTAKDWENFSRIIQLCPNVEYVTIEYYRDKEKLIRMLRELKEKLKALETGREFKKLK